MRRYSILTLMAFVFVAAVGMAALRNANEIWAGAMLTIIFVALATAVMGAVVLRGKEQYRWVGFAVYSGGYLALTLGSGVNFPFKSQFGTTAVLGYVQSQVEGPPASRLTPVPNRAARRAQMVERIESLEGVSDGANDQLLADLKKRLVNFDAATERQRALKATADRWRSLIPGAANAEQFSCVGHSLFALLAGMVGTVVASTFHARRERSEGLRNEV